MKADPCGSGSGSTTQCAVSNTDPASYRRVPRPRIYRWQGPNPDPDPRQPNEWGSRWIRIWIHNTVCISNTRIRIHNTVGISNTDPVSYRRVPRPRIYRWRGRPGGCPAAPPAAGRTAPPPPAARSVLSSKGSTLAYTRQTHTQTRVEEKPSSDQRLIRYGTPKSSLISHMCGLGSIDFDIFFRNSICFIYFWFGLEILRQVYKKAFFEILNSFYIIWPFVLQKM
jgi:hypothetical protein